MRKRLLFTSTLCLLVFSFCKKTDNPGPNNENFTPGKNRFTISLEGVEREYYVHVPAIYNGKTAVPVVFMLHGTSGNGLDMWERSGWKEVGDTANILTIYPSSMRYCINDTDGQKTTTKWNAQPVEWQFCNSSDAKDDILFLNTVLDEVIDRFNVDTKRVYLVGFSNGGQMAAKCSIFFSDRLAAVCANAGSFSLDTTWSPLGKIPTLFQLGNKDYGPGVEGPEISLARMDEVLTNPDFKPGRVAQVHIRSFGLSSSYTLMGDTNTAMIATYPSLTPGSTADYRFVFVKGLAHAYPNGINHWLKAAPAHWDWMKKYSR